MKQSGRKWGDYQMLMGEFHHNIDEKSRLIIPSKFRNELGDRVVITKGLDKCLFVYSEHEWNKIMQTEPVFRFYLISAAFPVYSVSSFLFKRGYQVRFSGSLHCFRYRHDDRSNDQVQSVRQNRYGNRVCLCYDFTIGVYP